MSHRVLLQGLECNGLYKLDLLNFVSLGYVNKFATSIGDTAAYSVTLNSYVTEPIDASDVFNVMSCDENTDILNVTPVDHHDSIIIVLDDKHTYILRCLVSLLNFTESSHLWHMRLVHPSNTVLINLLCLHDLPFKHVPIECVACAICKSKRQPHSSSDIL